MPRGGWIAIAVLFLALIVFALRTCVVAGPEPEAGAGASEAATADAVSTTKAQPKPKAPGPVDLSAADALQPSVSLDAVDRDRDLHGVVVRRDGSPVAGADVAAVFHPWRRAGGLSLEGYRLAVDGPRTRTAADGTFALRLRRGTRAELRVSAAGFPVVKTPERLAGERVRIVVEPGVRLRVAVLDETNRVAPGVRLSVRDVEATSDAEGVAVFDDLPPSSRFSVELLSEGWADLGIREFATTEGPVCEERLVLRNGRTLRGRVVDAATDAPIAKARVGMNWTCEHAVETDADGRYALPGWAGVNVREVTVVAAGYAREEAEVGALETIDFRLKRGFAATGRVVNESGTPVTGALVEVIASTFAGGRQRTSFDEATSDADGRFHVDGLDPAMGHVVIVCAEGFGKSRRPLPPPGSTSQVEIGDVTLRAGRVLAGRFVDADGKALADRWVVLEGPGSAFGAGFENNDYGAQEDVRTDDLGRFAFADLAPGDYVVRTQYDGSLQTDARASVPTGRDVLDLLLRLAPSCEVEVRVVDDTGAPVPAADVNAWTDGDDWPVSARTDPRGVARLRVTWDEGRFGVSPPYGVTRRFIGCDDQEWKKGDALKPFVLREGAAVQGVVVDPQGRGIPAAKIRVEGGGEPRWRETDDSGRFDWVFEKGATARLVFDGTSQGRECGLSGAVDCTAPQAGVVLHAAPIETDRALSIRVRTPGGDPAQGVVVDVCAYGWSESRTAATDAEGVARLDALPARPLKVFARATDAWARSAAVDATPAGQQVVVALRRGVTVRGVVLGPDGKPAQAAVTVLRGDERAGDTATDAEGKFALLVPADAEGAVNVFASSAEGRGSAAVESPEPEVRITLAK